MIWIVVVLSLIIEGTMLFFPTFIKSKAENFATKQDIEKITKITKDVENCFNKNYKLFCQNTDYYEKQYTNLYCKLYSIVIQSEYLRYSNNETKYKKLSFDETPFIDLLGLYIEDNPIRDIQNQVLSFNSKSLCEYIISMSHYATPELLKAAVSYRFIYSCVNAPAPNLPEGRKLYVDEDEEVFNEAQQKLLLKTMVMTIVKDYNFLRQKLDLDYSNEELSTGLISL